MMYRNESPRRRKNIGRGSVGFLSATPEICESKNDLSAQFSPYQMTPGYISKNSSLCNRTPRSSAGGLFLSRRSSLLNTPLMPSASPAETYYRYSRSRASTNTMQTPIRCIMRRSLLTPIESTNRISPYTPYEGGIFCETPHVSVGAPRTEEISDASELDRGPNAPYIRPEKLSDDNIYINLINGSVPKMPENIKVKIKFSNEITLIVSRLEQIGEYIYIWKKHGCGLWRHEVHPVFLPSTYPRNRSISLSVPYWGLAILLGPMSHVDNVLSEMDSLGDGYKDGTVLSLFIRRIILEALDHLDAIARSYELDNRTITDTSEYVLDDSTTPIPASSILDRSKCGNCRRMERYRQQSFFESCMTHHAMTSYYTSDGVKQYIQILEDEYSDERIDNIETSRIRNRLKSLIVERPSHQRESILPTMSFDVYYAGSSQSSIRDDTFESISSVPRSAIGKLIHKMCSMIDRKSEPEFLLNVIETKISEIDRYIKVLNDIISIEPDQFIIWKTRVNHIFIQEQLKGPIEMLNISKDVAICEYNYRYSKIAASQLRNGQIGLKLPTNRLNWNSTISDLIWQFMGAGVRDDGTITTPEWLRKES